jgi:DNA mismatch repair protein MutH
VVRKVQVVEPPRSEAELLNRARALAGRRLADIAADQGTTAPPDLRHHKGWVGQLVERALGATAGSRAAPDFLELGIELKTLPVDLRGKPVESTFVCTVPLTEVGEVPWERSRVRCKLAQVLWVVVQGERAIPVGDRQVGAALLWTPSAAQERALQDDWEELAGIIGLGDIETINGRIGQFLQVRPKAAHSRVRQRSIDTEGEMIQTLPRGFYLRATFTAALLQEHFSLSGG